MTTANLSVGVITDEAKRGLLELKQWMKSELQTMTIGVDQTAMANSVKAALAGGVPIDIDEASLKASIGRHVRDALNPAGGFKLTLDTADITTKVKAAAAAGLAGLKLADGTAGTAVSSGTLEAQLVPALDRMVKSIDDAFRSVKREAGAGGGTTRSKTRASSGYSYTNPETGERLSYSTGLDKPDEVLTTIQTRSSDKRKIDEERRALSEDLRDAQRTYTMRRSWRRASERTEEQGAREQMADAQRTFAMRRSWSRANETEAARQLREAQTDANRTYTMRRSFARAQENEAARLAREEQADANRTFAARRAYARAQESEEARQLREAQQDSNRTFAARRAWARAQEAERARQAREEEVESRRALAARQASARAVETELQAAMRRVFTNARFNAPEDLNARGKQVFGAQAVVNKFGDSNARNFFGNDALVDAIPRLDSFKRKMTETAGETEKARGSMKAYREAMSDAHSVARGLAGSLGAIWLTWGSMAQIAGGFALGSVLREAFVEGKNLEFQLTFVKELTGANTVAMRDFANAVRGSLVMPEDASGGLRALAQNGLDAVQSMQVLPTILQLATVGEMSLSDAALGATGVLAAFNLQVGEIGRVSDVFAKAAAESNTSVSGMVEAMKQASTVSDQYGVSLEETAATLAMMAKRNIEGSAAGTAFRNMMVELATPTKAARQSINALGLEIYNTSTGKLKPYAEILEEVRNKTITLNEESKLNFVNAIFGERGGKAANAILSDFDKYQETLRSLKEEAIGFTDSVSKALSETTEGKVRAVMSEFKLSAAEAFGEGKNSVDAFVDSLRGFLRSNEFKNGFGGLVSNIAALTRLLAENGDSIVYLVSVYAAYRVAAGAASVMTEKLGIDMAATAVAARGLSVSVGAVWGTATLGLSILVPLVAQWALFTKHTNEADEAQRAFNETLKRQTEDLRTSNEGLERTNRILVRRNELMLQGKNYADAQKQAELDTDRNAATSMQDRLETERRQLARMRIELAELKKPASPEKYGASTSTEQARRESAASALRESIALKEQGIAELAERNAEKQRNVREKETSALQDDLSKRLSYYQEYNKRLDDIQRRNPKLKLSDLRLTQGDVTGGSREDFEALQKQRNEDLNARLEKRALPDPSAGRAADKLDDARFRGLVDRLRQEEAEIKQQISLRRDLNAARFDPAIYGQEMAAILGEAQARDGLLRTIEFEQKALATLKAEKTKAGTDASEAQQIDNEIQRRQASIAELRRELKARQEIAEWQSKNGVQKANNEQANWEAKFDADQATRISKIREKTDLKVMDPVDAARSQAILAVQSEYARDIAQQTEKVRQLEDARLALGADLSELQGNELITRLTTVDSLDATVAREREILNVRQAMANVAATQAGGVAADEIERSQTAQYGMERFWAEYQRQGVTSADMVYQALKSSADLATDAWVQFATTGKMNFRSLLASMAAEAAKLLASKVIMQLAQLMVGLLGGGTSVDTSGYAMSSTGFATSAGISGGRSSGGPVYPGQRVMVGELGPEVLEMGTSGGYVTSNVGLRAGGYTPSYAPTTRVAGNTTVNMSVTVMTDGSSKVQKDASGEQAKQMAKLMESEVLRILAEQQRPGGQLYR